MECAFLYLTATFLYALSFELFLFLCLFYGAIVIYTHLGSFIVRGDYFTLEIYFRFEELFILLFLAVADEAKENILFMNWKSLNIKYELLWISLIWNKWIHALEVPLPLPPILRSMDRWFSLLNEAKRPDLWNLLILLHLNLHPTFWISDKILKPSSIHILDLIFCSLPFSTDSHFYLIHFYSQLFYFSLIAGINVNQLAYFSICCVKYCWLMADALIFSRYSIFLSFTAPSVTFSSHTSVFGPQM